MYIEAAREKTPERRDKEGHQQSGELCFELFIGTCTRCTGGRQHVHVHEVDQGGSLPVRLWGQPLLLELQTGWAPPKNTIFTPQRTHERQRVTRRAHRQGFVRLSVGGVPSEGSVLSRARVGAGDASWCHRAKV